MANCSIPNSTPASGRISTRSLKLSKKQNRTAARYQALSSTKAIAPWSLGFFNAQRSTLNVQRSIQTVESRTLDVGRWAFSTIRRVKGAWWPSRSSKPSSPRKWRGRFDSYPLRLDCSTLNAQGPTLNVQLRQLGVERWTLDVERFLLNSKGGDVDVARADP